MLFPAGNEFPGVVTVAGMSLLVVVFLPAAAVSLGLAFLPWRPPRLRAILLWAQVAAVGVIAALVPPGPGVWLAFLGPGAAVAAVRGIDATHAARR